MNKQQALSWTDIRSRFFSLDSDRIYMNSSSFGATLNSVTQRMREVQDLYSLGANIDRWIKEIAMKKNREVDAVFGNLVKAPAIDTNGRKKYFVGTVDSVTEGMSLVANGISLGPGDVILTTEQEHDGGSMMWDLLAKRRHVNVVRIDLLKEPAQDKNWSKAVYDLFVEKLKEQNKKAKEQKKKIKIVVSFSWITFSTGHVLPVREICAATSAHGAISVVDAAQAFGVIPINFEEIGADFMVVNGHKYLNGPIGTGFICMRDRPAKEFWPTVVDRRSSIVDDESKGNLRCTKGGVAAYTNLMALHEALKFYENLGPCNVYNRLQRIGTWIRDGLSKYPDTFELLTPIGEGCSVSMTCVRIGDFDRTKEVYEKLKSDKQPWKPIHGLTIVETEALRLSPHYFNTAEELNTLADALCFITKVDRRKWPTYVDDEDLQPDPDCQRWSGPCATDMMPFGRPIDERLAWPLPAPFQVMSTLSKLDFYGRAPGFHHGLDLRVPAGTPVVSPVHGTIENVGHYYAAAGDYAYEVAIKVDDDIVWRFHHIDPASVPKEIRKGAKVAAGDYIADIYDPAVQGIDAPPHLHIEIVDSHGYWHDPLNWLPSLDHEDPPVLRGAWVVDSHNRVISEFDGNDRFKQSVSVAKHELVLDIVDFIPPVGTGDAIKELQICLDCQEILHLRFDRLPYTSYMRGADEVYKIEPVIRSDGACLANFNVDEPATIHLYRCALNLHGSNIAVRSLRVRARGYAGNQLAVTCLLPTIIKKSR
ncbi:MAG: aminotransferase class V-fold PLP-dependent enzyme [Candidatus Thiodiazotropha endolucinida]